MTTYGLQTALRHALTTLANSPPFSVGSQPSPIDKLLTREERLAARMVRRYSLRPPVDVEKLASLLADVADKNFPVQIDGLCLDLKVPGKRPKVWVSKSLPQVRRRFTLAHEIGHIVIPWHTGSIVDDLEAPRRASGRYKTMEGEANRFAAELLMPSEWVIGLSERADHAAGLLTTINRVAEVSFEAALFRTYKYAPPGYIIGEVRDGVLISSRRTRGTRTNPPEDGTLIHLVDMPTAEDPYIVAHNETRYFFWRVDNNVRADQRPSRPWRDIFNDILSEIPVEHRKVTLNRLNAIVGAAIGKLPKGTFVDEIYGRALASTRNRSVSDPWIAVAIAHPLFDAYILARCYERSEA